MLEYQAGRQFLLERINPILEKLIIDLVTKRPQNVVDHMIQWLQSSGKSIEQLINPQAATMSRNIDNDDSDDASDEDEEPFELMDKNELIAMKKDYQSRNSVSAEAFGKFNKKGNFKPKFIIKTSDQVDRITARLSQSFMFQALDQSDLKIVINAMEEQKFAPGDTIIQQGADGDHLYVVDEGELQCFRCSKKGEEEKLIKLYLPGESFGELALLYNAPRAATIKANQGAILFSLDRQTFNHIVKDATSKKRQQYEEFLSRIELLQDMDSYERLQIADALKSQKFKHGEYIVREGDKGDTFYFLESGECVATKNRTNQSPEIVFHYKRGDYFGELSMLRNIPRAANILAENDVSVVYLDRNSFQRLIGPIGIILQRNFQRYEKFVN